MIAPPLIELESLSFSYTGSQSPVLDRINLTLQHQQQLGLIGPNGCGKTTLLNIISGLITPTEGRVLFDGRDVTDITTGERQIAQVFQFPVLYEAMSVRENLSFPARQMAAAEQKIDEEPTREGEEAEH